MLTCKHVTRLLSESEDRTLTFSERMGLRLHWLLCSGCRHYGEQLQVVRMVCHHLGDREDDSGKKKLSP